MIQLQFSTSGKLFARLVRAYTWSQFSHCDFVLPDGRLLGAQLTGGVQIRKPDYEKFTRVARYTVDAPDAVIDFAMKQVGKPYDLKAVIGLAVHRDWESRDRWYCIDLIEAAFDVARSPLLDTPHVDRLTPRDLMMSPRLVPVS